MATLEEWTTYFYADISAQLRRHGVNQRMFDGLYLSKTSITGSWLLTELGFKYAILADKRDAMFVAVLKGGFEAETWKLVWHYKHGQTDVYHSTSNFPGPRVDRDGRVTIRDCILPPVEGSEGQSV